MKAILFQAGEHQVAVNLLGVREVLRRVQGTDAPDGMEIIRRRFVRVMSASQLTGLPSTQDQLRKTILIQQKDQFLGVNTSQVSRVFEFNESALEPVTGWHAGVSPQHCDQMIQLEGHVRPIFLLNLTSVFKAHEAGVETSEAPPAQTKSQSHGLPDTRLVCFLVGGCEYAFTIQETVEIIRGRPAHFIPHSKEVVEGVINLRGNVVPIIDLRRMVHMENVEQKETPKDATKVIITKISQQTVGFRVDQMTEVVSSYQKEIEATPPSFEKMGKTWIRGVLRLKKSQRLIFIIDGEWFHRNTN